jgi:hypothetical protein
MNSYLSVINIDGLSEMSNSLDFEIDAPYTPPTTNMKAGPGINMSVNMHKNNLLSDTEMRGIR